MRTGIYISRRVLNSHDLISWAKQQGFATMMPPDNIHVTIVYCKKNVDWNRIVRGQPSSIVIGEDEDELRTMTLFDGGATVLEVSDDRLTERNTALAKRGIKSKFPIYRAHITITYECPDDLDIDAIEPYRGIIVLGPEVFEDIDDDWANEHEEIDLSEIDDATEYPRLFSALTENFHLA